MKRYQSVCADQHRHVPGFKLPHGYYKFSEAQGECIYDYAVSERAR